MKILVMCYEYPPVGGGGGRVAQSVADKLAARGHEVHVQTAGMPHLRKVEQNKGVTVCRSRSFRRREDRCTVPEMALFLLTSFIPTLRHIRTWRPDVIHAHFAVPTGVLAWAVSRITGVPYVLTVHLGDVPGGFPDQTETLFQIVKPLTVPIWERAAAISAVSGHVRDLALRAYGRQVEKILNGIEIDHGCRGRTEPRTPPRLTFAGRFVSQKNLHIIVEALAKLRDIPWQATLLGDGPLMGDIRNQIKRCGLDSRIKVPGWCDAATVEKTMSESDIFILASSAEGLPVAAIQALRYGLAIVGTNIPGLDDVVEDGRNGFRVPVGSIDALVERLHTVLTRPLLLQQMQAASHEQARLFDLDAITAQYENLLRGAAARPRNHLTQHVT